jgi:release factor glutamine methyltransferase
LPTPSIARDALRQGVALLREAGVDDARLVAEVLLCQALRIDRGQLYARLDEPLAAATTRRWRALLRRAAGHEPLAYVVGRREFYGLDFCVDRRVLIPRPETELLVEEAIAWSRAHALRAGRSPLIADIGTGSGAIAVALAVHLPEARLYAVDASAAALQVARRNARRHGVAERIALLHGGLLAPLPEPVDLVVANLPYLSDAEMAALPAHIARFEPAEALAGGPDGLDAYRALFAQVPGRIRPEGALLVEIGAAQAEAAAALARGVPGAAVAVLPDLAGLPRVLRVRLPAA